MISDSFSLRRTVQNWNNATCVCPSCFVWKGLRNSLKLIEFHGTKLNQRLMYPLNVTPKFGDAHEIIEGRVFMTEVIDWYTTKTEICCHWTEIVNSCYIWKFEIVQTINRKCHLDCRKLKKVLNDYIASLSSKMNHNNLFSKPSFPIDRVFESHKNDRILIIIEDAEIGMVGYIYVTLFICESLSD